MKTSLFIMSCLAALCASPLWAEEESTSGATSPTPVAEWSSFTATTSDSGTTCAATNNSSYTLNLGTGGSSTVTDGVLSAVGGNTTSSSTVSPYINLSSANLTLNSGLTVSLTLSNVSCLSADSTSNRTHSLFALAAGSTYAALVMAGYDSSSYAANVSSNSVPHTEDCASFVYNGSVNNVSFDSTKNIAALKEATPLRVTVTLSASELKLYLGSDLIVTGTIVNSNDTANAATITQLSLGSWAGSYATGLLSESVHNLAIYNGAMSASEVAALNVPEPAAASLGLLGLAGLLLRRRVR